MVGRDGQVRLGHLGDGRPHGPQLLAGQPQQRGLLTGSGHLGERVDHHLGADGVGLDERRQWHALLRPLHRPPPGQTRVPAGQALGVLEEGPDGRPRRRGDLGVLHVAGQPVEAGDLGADPLHDQAGQPRHLRDQPRRQCGGLRVRPDL